MILIHMAVLLTLIVAAVVMVDRIRWSNWMWQRGGPMDLTSLRKQDKMNETNGPDLNEGHDFHNGNNKENTR